MMSTSPIWNRVLGTASALALVVGGCGITTSAQAAPQPNRPAESGTTTSGTGFNLGRGIADITSEPAEVGFMGYGDGNQKGSGVHMRQFARAFVVQDAATGKKQAIVVADALATFDSVRQGVLKKLKAEYGAEFGEENVMLTANHTHSATGGYSWDTLYNVTTNGYHPKSYNAVVDGIVKAIRTADADLSSGSISYSSSTLANANANRSMEAFNRNPQWIKDRLPNGQDQASVTMRFEKNGRTDAFINWFAVHATSLPTTNTLLSTDNKGYAQYVMEKQRGGVDYLSGARPSIVGAFSAGTEGDQTPNLALKPGQGPTSDPFENLRIIGQRQADAVQSQLSSAGTSGAQSGVDSRITYVDMAAQSVRPEFTGTGKTETTCTAALGGPFGAGSEEDGGGGLPILHEGAGSNPFAVFVSSYLYVADPALIACQKPKQILLATGTMPGWTQRQMPVQLIRIGDHYIVGVPSEMTAAAGVVMRSTVAKKLGVPESQVIIQSNANAYGHYVTTPEEYDAQQYEGGAEIFGRYELPAYVQAASDLAVAMKEGKPVDLGTKPADRSASMGESLQGKVLYDIAYDGSYGKQITAPAAAPERGATVSAVFSGAHPNNDLHPGGTYMAVERQVNGSWVRVADDTDFSTRFAWQRYLAAQSKVTLSWTVPADAPAGTYRFRYYGDAKDASGKITPFQGISSSFTLK